MRQPSSRFFLSLLSTISFTQAQTTTATAAGATASPNGLIVPFSSGLPACASLCGPLFDVQGKCTPPNIAATNDSCFCTDPRLTAFDNSGTSGVSTVCGPESCTSTTDLQDIKTWYDNFCKANKAVTSQSSSAASSTSTASSGSSSAKAASVNQTWIQGHWKWVVMLVALFVVIVGGWIGACLLRRRYIRKREKEIEMLPPIATGPHHLQATTGGYSDGTFDARKVAHDAGGHSKEASSTMNPTKPKSNIGERKSKGWLQKARY